MWNLICENITAIIRLNRNWLRIIAAKCREVNSEKPDKTIQFYAAISADDHHIYVAGLACFGVYRFHKYHLVFYGV